MLDLNTLKWVLSISTELQNKIWDLREAIHTEIEKQKEDGKEEINIHG